MLEGGEITKDDGPTDEELRRFDKRPQGKEVSNKKWEALTNEYGRAFKMKDGRTNSGHNAEHVACTRCLRPRDALYALNTTSSAVESGPGKYCPCDSPPKGFVRCKQRIDIQGNVSSAAVAAVSMSEGSTSGFDCLLRRKNLRDGAPITARPVTINRITV